MIQTLVLDRLLVSLINDQSSQIYHVIRVSRLYGPTDANPATKLLSIVMDSLLHPQLLQNGIWNENDTSSVFNQEMFHLVCQYFNISVSVSKELDRSLTVQCNLSRTFVL